MKRKINHPRKLLGVSARAPRVGITYGMLRRYFSDVHENLERERHALLEQADLENGIVRRRRRRQKRGFKTPDPTPAELGALRANVALWQIFQRHSPPEWLRPDGIPFPSLLTLVFQEAQISGAFSIDPATMQAIKPDGFEDPDSDGVIGIDPTALMER